MDMQQTFVPGATVYGADGDKVGTVAAVGGSYIVVEKGFFFPKDYYIPVNAVTETSGDAVHLSVTKDQALDQGWDREPVDTSTNAMGNESATQSNERSNQMVATEEDVLTVPIHEEHLEASKRMVDAGEVTLTKHVVTEQETIEVPVAEERVRVDWRAPSGDGMDDGAAFEEGSFEIPVSREEVDVSKRTVQTGEVHVEKEREERSQAVSGSVRREVVDVEDTTGGASTPAR